MAAWQLALIVLQASPGNADLEAAARAYAQGNYQQVLPALHSAWRAPMSDADMRRALELEALTRVAFDQAEPAIEAFQYLLAVAPQFLPEPQASPKVLAFFAEARRRGPLGVLSRPQAQRPAWTQPPPKADEVTGTPLYKRWWFWTGAAVIVAGGGFGAWEAFHPVVPNGSLPGRTMQ